MAEISEKEYQGLVKMHGEEAVKHLKPAEKKPDEAPEEKEEIKSEVKTEEAKEEKKQEEVKVEAKELSESDFIEFYKKKTGKELKSFDELMPQETLEDKKEKREAAKLAYALQNNIISKKDHDSYVVDSANTANLVFEDFKADALAEDANLTDAEIQEQYAEEYGLNADPESAKYKRGQKKLAMLGDKMLKEKHASVFEIEGKYSQHETAQSAAAERAAKIADETPKYKQTIDNAFSKSIIVPLEVGDKKYEIKLSEEDVADIKSPFLSKKLLEENITNGYVPEELEAVIEMAVFKKHKNKILEQFYNAASEDFSKGVRGILPQADLRKKEDEKSVLSEKEKIAFTKMGLLQPTN